MADLVVAEFTGWPPRAWLDAILESITSLFPDPPAITTLTQGEAPAEAQLSGPLAGRAP